MKFEYTVTGKTVTEAYDKATALYASLGEIVESKVVSEGKKGFLGIFGAQDAEIRVIVDDGKEERKAPVTEKKADNKNNNKNNNAQKNNKGEKQNAPKNEGEKKAEVKVENNAETAKNSTQGAQNAPKKNNKKQRNNAPQNNNKQEEKAPLKDEDIKVTVEEKQLAIGFIKSFVESIGMDCEVKGDLTPDSEGYVSRVVTIEGQTVSSLIGHHGETLDAIQYLANLCLARKSEGDHKEYVKVIVDIENYREKREATLRALARKMADKALRQKRNVHLDPMNPYERRIIHSEIQKIDGVSTHSVGYDETRKIIITIDKK